mmetsp:Transcript_53293/g.121474  ORF Transcript_53293/g.121474 Transcript_53293/m.121474 type:complete len:192 (-) Transcript_53293:1416-1991(-)
MGNKESTDGGDDAEEAMHKAREEQEAMLRNPKAAAEAYKKPRSAPKAGPDPWASADGIDEWPADADKSKPLPKKKEVDWGASDGGEGGWKPSAAERAAKKVGPKQKMSVKDFDWGHKKSVDIGGKREAAEGSNKEGGEAEGNEKPKLDVSGAIQKGEDQEKAFEKAVQKEASSSHPPISSGLGLAAPFFYN